MGQHLQFVLIWMSFPLAFLAENKVKTSFHELHKVEIELDIFGNEARIIYNDTMRVKAKVAYMPKKKVIAYKDEKNGRCLLENIKHQGNAMRIKYTENEELYSKVYQASGIPIEKNMVKKIAGRRIVSFCGKLPMFLLKEFGKMDDRAVRSPHRVKRENYYEMRRNESEISHHMPKKLGKRQYPSGSAKTGPSGGVDYHARIRNNLHPGAHGMHPIDITSSVTITTGSAIPVRSHLSSDGNLYPHYQNGTKTGHGRSRQFPMATGFFNTSHTSHGPSAHSLVKEPYSPNVQPEGISYSPSSDQSFQLYHPSPATSNSHVAHKNATNFSHKSSATDIGQSSTESKFHTPSYYVPSISSRGSYAHSHVPAFQSEPGHNQAYFPPSSSSKDHHSILHNQNISQHESRFSPGRSVSIYASQFPPSGTHETSHIGVRYEKPHNHQIDAKRTFSHHSLPARYPLSSVSQNYRLPHSSGLTGTPNIPLITQYLPSSSGKIHPYVGHFGPSVRPATLSTQKPINELRYSTGTIAPSGVPDRPSVKEESKSESYPSSYAKNIPYSSANIGQTSVSPTAPDMENSKSGFHQPSSESKMHYLPSNAGRDIHSSEHFNSFPPSSTSKLNYSPIHHVEIPSGRPTSHVMDELPPVQFSSTTKTHYMPATESQTRAQIPQPPSDRNFPEHFPLSSTSKTHQFVSRAHAVPVQHSQHYPPSATTKHQANRYGVIHGPVSHHHPGGAYYSPSSVSKMQNFSSHLSPFNKHFYSPEFYQPSSTAKVYHVPPSASGHDSHLGSHYSLPGKTLMTSARDAYYPSSPSSKTSVHSQVNGHLLHHPYYGPSSHHVQKQSSHSPEIPENVLSSTNGHTLYSSTPYPSSAISKHQPVLHHNVSEAASRAVHEYNVKNLHPMLQHSSSPGSKHYWPAINSQNDTSSSGGKAHTYNLPNGVYSQEVHSPQYPPSSSSSRHSQRNGQSLSPSGQGSDPSKNQITCQSTPRSTYSIITRTILTPNGLVQRPSSIKTNEQFPCGEANIGESVLHNNRPCYASGRYGQAVRDKAPCTIGRSNRNMRKSQRSITATDSSLVPNVKISHFPSNHPVNTQSATTPRSNNQNTKELSDSEGVIITDMDKSQIELMDGISDISYADSNDRFQFSRLKASHTVNSTSQGNEDVVPEFSDQDEDVEMFESKKEKNTRPKSVKYEKLTAKAKNVDESEEKVKEGDILEPGDRILGKDGYTILDGFRGRVVSVTGQVGKIRAETTKNKPNLMKTNSNTNNSNSGQFRYSSELGRYVKDDGNFSKCDGEVTFTCTEFLGSNGRAKICKPNPRRNPDGSPC